jgi:quercetin dioxygenase-like cupin family protein/alkylhydroperoxidase/carboxymuconolactone decarboxylase family protein YurZ
MVKGESTGLIFLQTTTLRMKLLKLFLLSGLSLCSLMNNLNAQQTINMARPLDRKQQSIVTISGLTAKGDLTQLQTTLSDGLDAGMTVNEIKEVLVHLSAYCGFPRSLQGINTFIAVLDARKKNGIRDNVGREATPVKTGLSKYEQGKQTLETLTGQQERDPKTGYAAFAPIIDTYLKEHLFADIFSRDILSYTEREIATVSALVSLGGVEPMMRGHMGITLGLGITESQLREMLSLIESKVGKEEADAGRRVLSAITGSAPAQTSGDSSGSRNAIFPKGQKITNDNFIGTAWLQPLVAGDSLNPTSVGNVTFEPGARTKWHLHPGGQILLATGGVGYYQEKGSPKRILRKGDVVKCPPSVPHWHGAGRDDEFIQVAITSAAKGATVWLQPVTDEEYNSSN